MGAAAGSGYKVIKKIPVAGEGGWDYLTVDPDALRRYVSHGTRVEVIDLDTEKVVGQIPDTAGVYGIALVPESGRGYTSNGKSNNSKKALTPPSKGRLVAQNLSSRRCRSEPQC